MTDHYDKNNIERVFVDKMFDLMMHAATRKDILSVEKEISSIRTELKKEIESLRTEIQSLQNELKKR